MSRSPDAGPTIYATIVDLSNANRVATRPVLAEITGLTMSVIDYHVQTMVSDGRIRRVLNGVYEPVPAPREDRAVSFTIMPDGICKLEIGDHCLEVSMREARHIGAATGGVSLQFARTGLQ